MCRVTLLAPLCVVIGCARPVVVAPPIAALPPAAALPSAAAHRPVAADVSQANAVSRQAGGCLPAELHGELREQRGAWRLYTSASGEALFLEHQGVELVIIEREVGRLRGVADSEIVHTPIHGFGSGLCDNNIPPHRGVCLRADILPGTDPFVVAERLDDALGEYGARACYGVYVLVEEMARLL